MNQFKIRVKHFQSPAFKLTGDDKFVIGCNTKLPYFLGGIIVTVCVFRVSDMNFVRLKLNPGCCVRLKNELISCGKDKTTVVAASSRTYLVRVCYRLVNRIRGFDHLQDGRGKKRERAKEGRREEEERRIERKRKRIVEAAACASTL